MCLTQTSVIQLYTSSSTPPYPARPLSRWRLFRHSLLALSLTLLTSQPLLAADAQLGQLSLQDAEQLFRNNNRELLSAKREVEGSQADTLSAAARPNPNLSFNSTNFRLNQSNGGGGLDNKTLDSILRVDQLIERGNKRELRMAAAQDVLQASQFDLRDTMRQQRLGLRSAYYDLLLTQQKEEVLQNTQELYQNTLQAVELRFKAGDVPATDVSRIRVDALRAQNDLRQAQADRAKAQATLAYIIGRENDAAALHASDGWPEVVDVDNATSTLDQRPDVLAAEARKKAAEESRRLAEALKTRDIVVGVQYEHYPNDSRNTVGAGVSIPLFTNYQYQGEIARAQVNFDAATEAQDQTRAQAQGEITRARADLDAAIEKLQRFDQQMLSEARKAAAAAEFAYQHGAMGVTDLLDSRRVLRALELEAATVRADYAKSLAAWQAATSPEENP